jgi:hypothetical protein
VGGAWLVTEEGSGRRLAVGVGIMGEDEWSGVGRLGASFRESTRSERVVSLRRLLWDSDGGVARRIALLGEKMVAALGVGEAERSAGRIPVQVERVCAGAHRLSTWSGGFVRPVVDLSDLLGGAEGHPGPE